MTLTKLEEKYPTFEYFNSFDGWVFKTDYFKVTFELKDSTEVEELIAEIGSLLIL